MVLYRLSIELSDPGGEVGDRREGKVVDHQSWPKEDDWGPSSTV